MSSVHGEPRDPVTGTPASRATAQRAGKVTPDDMVERIRATRAQMSDTLDEIEYRISPSTITDEIKQSVRETVNEVREQINPRRMAKRAGDTMFETIKENPVPALIAGLSIGYLVKKAADGDHDEVERRGAYPAYRDRRAPQTRADRPGSREYRYQDPRTYGLSALPSSSYEEDEDSSLRDMPGRAREFESRAEELGYQARRTAEEGARAVKEQTAEAARSVGDQAREAGEYVSRRAKRAERTIEEFVRDNPLVAGLITAGIGAVVGAAFPSTRKEDELMGPARDQLVDRARDAAEEKVEQVKGAAERVGEDARRHVQEFKEEAKEEVRHMDRSDGGSAGEESRPMARNDGRSVGQQNRPSDPSSGGPMDRPLDEPRRRN